MTEWIGGIDWFPGLRVIPESRQYKVRPNMLDMIIVDLDNRKYRCTVVSKYTRQELACFNWERMVDLLQERFKEKGIPVTIRNVQPEPWVVGNHALTRVFRQRVK